MNQKGETVIEPPYSDKLIELLKRCLHVDPAARPDLVDTLYVVEEMLRTPLVKGSFTNEQVTVAQRIETTNGYPPGFRGSNQQRTAWLRWEHAED